MYKLNRWLAEILFEGMAKRLAFILLLLNISFLLTIQGLGGTAPMLLKASILLLLSGYFLLKVRSKR